MSTVEEHEPMTAQEQCREYIAAHELGHAIGMREAGFTPGVLHVKDYWIFTGAHGLCTIKEKEWPTDENGNIPDEVVRGYMVMLLAGQAAVEHLAELRGEQAGFTGVSDYQEFHECAKDVPFPLEEAKAKARSLVATHWGEIAEWIDILAERGRLAGKKVM